MGRTAGVDSGRCGSREHISPLIDKGFRHLRNGFTIDRSRIGDCPNIASPCSIVSLECQLYDPLGKVHSGLTVIYDWSEE